MPPTNDQYLAVRREALGASLAVDVLSDADIAYYFDNGGGGSVVLTAALCCDMLAGAAGTTNFKWTADGTSIDKTMHAGEFRMRAAELRRRYYGSGMIAVSRASTDDDSEF